MRRNRGSVMLFVLIMVGLMTIAILAGVELSTSAAVLQSRREAEAKARYAFEGAVNVFLCNFRNKSATLPSTSSIPVGAQTVELLAQDYSGTKPRTIVFNGATKVQGKSYKFTKVAGNRLDPTPLDYAVFVNTNFDPSKAITLGENGANGDMTVNGSIANRTNPFVINGDLETTGTTYPSVAVIKGNLLTGEQSVAFPNPNGASYLAAALISLLTNTLGNYVFPTADPYPIIYRLGALSLSGSFKGKGTVFVSGAVTITGNMTYADANSRLVVIATGGITVDAAVTDFVGMYFSQGTFRTNGNVKLSPGAIATQSLLLGGSLDVIHDSGIWTDATEGVKHKAPGYWP